MCVPDLSSGRPAGHSPLVLRIRASALSAISGCLLLLAGCGSAESADGASSPSAVVPGVNPWVLGGQTGALMPACGLTPAATAGDSIPGGDSGIVIHTQACVGFAAAELELRDENGMPVAFDLESLPGGAMLLRPRAPLRPGIYHVTIAGMEMESVVAEEPPELPMQLGTLTPLGPRCGLDVELTLDPLLPPYLPQLKLSASVDGGAERTWFDYGMLDVTGGRATLSWPSCGTQQQPCFPDGVHRLRVTGELAGELGTLAPIEVAVETRCGMPVAATSVPGSQSNADGDDGAGQEMDCGVTPARRTSGGHCALLGLGLALGLLAVRRARRASG
jgi:hypothetical protein